MFSSKDSWLSDYDALVQLGARIGVKIRDRDEQERGSLQRNKIVVKFLFCRCKLKKTMPDLYTCMSEAKQYKLCCKISCQLDYSVDGLVADYQKQLQSLKASLHKHSTTRKITELEYERRKGMLQELTEKYQQLEKAKSRGWAPSYQALDAVDDWGAGPGVGHRMTAEGVRMQQQAIIVEQDRGLDQLSHALRRQREVGLTIQGEVEEQNVLIDDIHQGTQHADVKVRTQTRRVEEVRRRDSCKCTCFLWTTIVILFILIIIVAFVKYDNKPGY